MQNAIILHGRPTKAEYYDKKFPSSSNAHWLPWLQNQLLARDIHAVTPEVPLAYEPLWERWVAEVERYEITSETILVGHSCGGGFWIRYLSEHPELLVGKVYLVAPWIDVEKDAPNNFFNFMLDTTLVSRTESMTLFHSTNDQPEIQSSVAKLRHLLPGLHYREFDNMGHFNIGAMPSGQFPELLHEIVGN